MQIFGSGSTSDKQTDIGVDANAESTTTPLKMGDARLAAFFIVGNTGTHATHVTTLQVSPDNVNWFDTAHTITGLGDLHDIGCAAEWARVKVITPEGAPSTVDVTIVIK